MHSFDKAALYWPSSPSAFVLDTLAAGMTPGGFFYSAFASRLRAVALVPR